MAEVQADVKLGDLLGKKISEGVYAMSDGKVYSDKDGPFEEADESVEIPDFTLSTAEDYANALKLFDKNSPKKESND